MNLLVLEIILRTINSINIIIHSLGTYLLIYLYMYGKDTPQQLFLISLSVSEILKNLLRIFTRPVLSLHISERFHTHVFNVLAVVKLIYYASMFYITIDRLLGVLLNLRYRVYCDSTKCKYLLLLTWTIGFLMSVVFVITYHIGVLKEIYPYDLYVSAVISFVYVIVALVTYGFIFNNYTKSRAMRHRGNTEGETNNNEPSIFQVFRQSKFFISILIITSFLVFVVLPDILYFFFAAIDHSRPPYHLIVVISSVVISLILSTPAFTFLCKNLLGSYC